MFDFAPEEKAQLKAQSEALEKLGSSDFKDLPEGLVEEYQVLRKLGNFARVSIPGADAEVVLDAGVFVPTDISRAAPVVIMPAPLAATGWESYPGMIRKFARRGYLAVAYSQRGLAHSSGKIEVAGPGDWADGSAVINWVLANYPQANPERIGFAGSSYGAGTSLLIAAHDERVRAVCAQSAWADLGRSLYENETRHLKAFEALVALFGEDRVSTEVGEIFDDFRANRNIDRLLEFSAERSPLTYLEMFNRRSLPIFLGTYWHETIFSVPAVVEFYRALTGPKSLLVQIGDHGGDEVIGFLGGISRPTATSQRWLDRYVAEASVDGASDHGVRAEYMHNLFALVQQPDWESYVVPPRRFHLGDPGDPSGETLLLDNPRPGWSRSFTAGVDTPATVAPTLVTTGLQERLGNPVVYRTAEIPDEHAVVWSSPPLARHQRIIGSTRLRFTVTPSAESVTLVAHLFDLNPANGRALIITSAPYTFLNDVPGETRTVEVELQPAHYVILAGHQLQLVVDSKDILFADATVDGSTIEISSPDGEESYLDIPIGDVELS
ncbi:alpha/beta fold hydrolase [Micromonospora pisi]|uniref:alpha/beta fold hydrolase n=1 Tax=Micromonospora pisi TaxID=589240 RepID=UPI001B87D331|nr:alpha/beta fold hydrolase [Micromonospora pisi]